MQPSLTEFLKQAEVQTHVGVYCEFELTDVTVFQVAQALSTELQDGIISESHDASVMAFNGRAQYLVAETNNNSVFTLTGLRQFLKDHSCHMAQTSQFMPQAMGFLSYDALHLFETITHQPPASILPKIVVNFYETYLYFDIHNQQLYIHKIVEINTDPTTAYQQAQTEIDNLIKKIQQAQAMPAFVNQKQTAAVITDVEDCDFIALVEQAKSYVTQGEVFQLVLSRQFETAYTADPLMLYGYLRAISPTPYLFYITFEDSVFIGASPEKLISVHQGKASINPIAGTQPRKQMSDLDIENVLKTSVKEVAEHMMLVDLGRNDLGRVCAPGSVQVDSLLQVKHFSHVSHLVSEISGQLRADCDALDALKAVFPAGTLTGAPKIRAMQLIESLEQADRGIYGGAIIQLDNQGNLDSCIAIRTAKITSGKAIIRAGAGIVFDSDPAAETAETQQKAAAMLNAIINTQASL